MESGVGLSVRVGRVTAPRRGMTYRIATCQGTSDSNTEALMIWLAAILVVAWLLGWGVFHVAGGLIHILLVVALVVFLINFFSGRRTV
jgi:hypothetical protein